jgi:3-oxoacyl-[acyl-carrier protein] reductase
LFGYEEQVILITGTSRGIGSLLVEHFLQQGAFVEGCSRSPWSFTHANYHHSVMDVSIETEVASMLSDIQRRHNRLDGVINNAGVPHQGFVMMSGKKAIESVFETNVYGTYLVSRASARLMQRRKYGRIVNMGSIALKTKMEGSAIYTASKGAVLEFTKVLAKELAPFNITCNMVAPGLVDTAMFRGLSEKVMEKCMDQLAVKRMTSIADLTNVIDFLLRKESSLITGQDICLGTIS